ncbi:hypothetical protein D3C77_235460 [compost metagenome]
MHDGGGPILAVHCQQAELLVVSSRNSFKQGPLTIHPGQQVADVRLRAVTGLVFGLRPLDHLVRHERGNVTVEAFRQCLPLEHCEVGQLQGLLELSGVEQPDQDVHQHLIGEVQAGFAVATDVLQVLGQQFVTLDHLPLLEAVEARQALEVDQQGVLHQLVVLLGVGRAGQRCCW